jgi:peptidoglycan/LPS O-acetylase OafA/YrhL
LVGPEQSDSTVDEAVTQRRTRLISIFRRITSGGQYIPEIDGLRFIAIVSVLVFHICYITTLAGNDVSNQGYSPFRALYFSLSMLSHGSRGVDIFFAISGFVLGIPFAKTYLFGANKISIQRYFLRRLTRLEPPYVVSQLFRLYPVMVAKGLTFLQVLPHFIAGLFYLHMIIYHTAPLVQLVGWSLEIEIQFYLLVPLLALLIFRKSALLRRSLLLGFLLLYGAVILRFADGTIPFPPDAGPPLATYLNATIIFWIRYFIAGFVVTDLYLTVMPKLQNHWIWDLLSAPCWVLAFALGKGVWNFWGPFILILAFFGAFKGVLLPRFFRLPFVSIVGGMCYSIYLTHSIALQSFYYVYMKLLPGIHSIFPRLIIGEILILPGLIVVGAIFFLLIERPCMDRHWPNRLAAWFGRRFGRLPSGANGNLATEE